MDCLEGMRQLPDCSVDLVVTDPPYRVTPRGNTTTMSGYWTSKIGREGKVFANNDIRIEDYLPELYRVLKNGTHCYIMCNANLVHFLKVVDESPFHFTKCLIWDKCNKICGTYYMGQYEYILLLRKGEGKPVNDCSVSDILRFPNRKTKTKDGGNVHDSEKPVDLMSVLITQSSDPDGVVLDPFMGSGTTAVAAIRTGRRFIGYEIDEAYCKVAQDRVADTRVDLCLF